MPYGQSHHPFENINTFNPKKWLRPVGFPADFIGEAIDQTRGWFYSMHVLSTALFGRGAFKNVIVTGLILDEKGEKKLSKSLQNYPDPMYIANSYGADALRFYLLSSPLMRGEDLNFSEKGVSEVLRKIIMRLLNVHAFYMLGKSKNSVSVSPTNSKNVLDIWILSRLAQTNEEVQKSLDIYQVDRATRPIESFIEDLSLWYVRRSRERFKKSDDDRDTAESVLRHVLMEISKIIAPFMPFTAESIFREIKIDSDAESVHLEKWPQKKSINIEVLAHMKSAREIVERALSLRNEECIKVRQPLASITIKSKLDKDILKLVRDEVNVKKILIDENAEYDVALDTKITDELKSEGEVREIIRSIQEERKKALLNTGEKVDITIHTDETIKKLIEAHLKKIQEVTNVSKIRYASSGEKLITIDR
jgi:isoleucyl-tRNA synthetase